MTAKIKFLNIPTSLADQYNISSWGIKQCVMQGSHGGKSGLLIVLPAAYAGGNFVFLFS